MECELGGIVQQVQNELGVGFEKDGENVLRYSEGGARGVDIVFSVVDDVDDGVVADAYRWRKTPAGTLERLDKDTEITTTEKETIERALLLKKLLPSVGSGARFIGEN